MLGEIHEEITKAKEYGSIAIAKQLYIANMIEVGKLILEGQTAYIGNEDVKGDVWKEEVKPLVHEIQELLRGDTKDKKDVVTTEGKQPRLNVKIGNAKAEITKAFDELEGLEGVNIAKKHLKNAYRKLEELME